MGDRGNIVVMHGKKLIYLYTHCNGSDIGKILRVALGRHQRWDDAPYLTRIIFSEMIKRDIEGETGYGIGPDMCDNNHNLLVVNPTNQTITETADEKLKPIRKWAFEDFLKMKYVEED